MDWTAWEPFYRRILDEFGYSAAEDRRSARRLASALPSESDGGSALADVVADAGVLVAGDGPSLEDDVRAVAACDRVVLAADGAAPRLHEAGVAVDGAVTDVDGAPDACAALTRNGVPVAVHAHGDNAARLEDWLSDADLAHVVGTTQGRPAEGIVNHGGFTDGDRAAFIADGLGAASIALAGFDLRDTAPGPEKRWKLRWAERLLRLLEDRRGEPLLGRAAGRPSR